MHLAEARVAADRIERLAVSVHDLEAQPVEEGRRGRPGLRFGDGQHQGNTVCGRHLRLRDDSLAVEQRRAETVAGGQSVEGRRQDEAGAIEVRDRLAIPDADGGDRLQPDRLPDAGGAGVVAARRLVGAALLAAGLSARTARHVVDADDEIVRRADLHVGREVMRKGGRAAEMDAGRNAIDVDLALEVDAAEVQEDLPALPGGGDADLAMVPHVLDEVGVADAREPALGAERHRDLAVEALAFVQGAPGVASRMAEVEFEGPGAVEVDPVLALELRARVLGTGNLSCLVHGGSLFASAY